MILDDLLDFLCLKTQFIKCVDAHAQDLDHVHDFQHRVQLRGCGAAVTFVKELEEVDEYVLGTLKNGLDVGCRQLVHLAGLGLKNCVADL